ncbi:hypothetical protein JQU17_12305 [Ponticoccus sp. SC2-23]|uniref:c-type cytochrome n=1 Tax=Alexandriicola marinus TaxID=2081710 RepID=UPI00193C21FB|nr:hypothetical protein [Alexandriicola marinus]MBM1221010.1 hypothetical protein [Ponticoccus sp. SC6-9]MBM1225580.1 hypothetical protein [Ponticoccus sp. SC6-15]MBM1227732.1 hypothetical protein [Ponticoccus sp. SC6-38]MBM1234630.1 hypothetical protein [Ponticoccus sp. SC6-45]MBM1238234.1 hypothetical protein [Ponticoccus sp. SC6-49]MBM1243503.1 hypothetical protein [Ponticoccus sp. SC2-64]MBM1248154.1 hypothetical protein [Ponticoccus sp. SC6-42]MBM1252634.1 hypothetical protein [Pontico
MRVSLAVASLLFAQSVSAQGLIDLGAAPVGALNCSGCHVEGSDLSLQGLSAAEIETAMRAFRDGTREATLMPRLAAGFSDQEIVDIAAWLSREGSTQ